MNHPRFKNLTVLKDLPFVVFGQPGLSASARFCFGLVGCLVLFSPAGGEFLAFGTPAEGDDAVFVSYYFIILYHKFSQFATSLPGFLYFAGICGIMGQIFFDGGLSCGLWLMNTGFIFP
jgi:hypothetical protein